MLTYVLRKAVNYLVLFFVAITFVYLLAGTQLEPKDRFREQLLQDSRPEQREALERRLRTENLDTSEHVFVRYGRWLSDLAFGENGQWNKPFTGEWPKFDEPFAWLAWQPLQDWGKSPTGGEVRDEVSTRMWVSLRLVTAGTLLGAISGTVIGAWTATRQYKRSDTAITLASLVIYSVPTFVIAILLQVLAIRFNNAIGSQFFVFLGETGRHGDGLFDGLVDRLRHLILPSVTLAVTLFAFYSRIQRNLMLDNLNADYVRTAQAKGLTRRRAVFKHALRTSLIPTATYFAFTVGTLFVGAAAVELIFGWHGMGIYSVQTIQGQDIHGAVAASAFAGLLIILAAILSEVFVALLDPRVRVG